MDTFATFAFVFPLLLGTFLAFFTLFYKRIRNLRYLRWLPSTEAEPEHSIQRPSNDNLTLAELGSHVGQETGNADNSLAVIVARTTPVRTSDSSHELEPEHSFQRPSDDNLDVTESDSQVGRETGNAGNSLEMDAERATSPRTSMFERSDEGCATMTPELLLDSTTAWQFPDSHATEVVEGS
jgi:hypothetical protein